MIARFLDWLLGEHCNGCGQRVFNRDLVAHYNACTRWGR